MVLTVLWKEAKKASFSPSLMTILPRVNQNDIIMFAMIQQLGCLRTYHGLDVSPRSPAFHFHNRPDKKEFITILQMKKQEASGGE